MIDCGVHVLKEGGVRSLFKGTFATLLRDVPGSVAWFGVKLCPLHDHLSCNLLWLSKQARAACLLTLFVLYQRTHTHSTYELLKLELTKLQGYEDPSKLSPLAVLTAGGMAGIANWVISIPPDVLKSRYQSAPPGQYANLLDVYRHLMRTEGPSALFAGLRPAMIRAFPANAACFMGMELARKTLSFMD
eukprot:scaffold34660_cov175-Amphora_coffeaeformis.AAC.5